MKSKTGYKKRRVVRKVKRRHHGGNKIISLRCPFTKSCQMLPDRYLCKGRTTYFTTVTFGSSAVNTLWFAQVNGNFAGTNNANINNATTYNTNLVPAGISYLIGNANAAAQTGGKSPYAKYRIHGSTIKVRFQGDPVSTNCPTTMCVFPTAGVSSNYFTGMPGTTLSEQPYAKDVLLPSYSLGKPAQIRHSMGTCEIFGDKSKSTMESGQFDITLATAPTNAWSWNVTLYTYANMVDYTCTGTVEIEVVYDMEFFNRNTYLSTVQS